MGYWGQWRDGGEKDYDCGLTRYKGRKWMDGRWQLGLVGKIKDGGYDFEMERDSLFFYQMN
jgi:hypothetical protein